MKIYCDGGARGNPGPAASAFVAYDNGGNLVHEDVKFLGKATNNAAEYNALIMALEWLAQAKAQAAEIILDSELVKKQMTGEYRIKDAGLQVLAMRAKTLESTLASKVIYSHTKREGNVEADKLVNTTLDARL